MFLSIYRVALVAVLCLGGQSLAHTYHSGVCPTVEPMSGFDVKQFLGVWYAVQKTATASSCIIYNITRGEEPGEYKVEQTSQHFALGLTPLNHEYSYTGQLTIEHEDVPAKMKVSFPLSVAGDSSFTVFMTDYSNYAGIFTCQKVTFAHRQSATLLSRTRTLDKLYMDKMRTRLASFSVDPFDLSIISQSQCPKKEKTETGYNIHIDDDTFSASSIGNAFRKAGEKIGDGVEWTINSGKKVYHRLADNDHTDRPPVALSDRTQKSNDINAEWVPQI